MLNEFNSFGNADIKINSDIIYKSHESKLYVDSLQVGKPPEKYLERYNFKFYDLNTSNLSADQRLVYQENYSVEFVYDGKSNKDLKIVAGFTFKHKEAIAEAIKNHNEKNIRPVSDMSKFGIEGYPAISFEDLKCVWIQIDTVKF